MSNHGKEREALKAAWNRVIESRGRPFPSGDAGYWFHQGFGAAWSAALAAREDDDTVECDSCNRSFPLSAIRFGRGGKASCPNCLAAREDTERPESEQERLAHLRCRCGTAIAVDCPEHGGGI